MEPGELANVAQAESWDGPEGTHWSANADQYDTSLREHLALLQRHAGIETQESVLDIGCGNGTSTLDAARAASHGRAVGIDLSTAMLARARDAASAAHLTNVEFVQGDAQVFPFADGAHDVAISRFGVMFFADPVTAFTNVARALEPGGRIAWIVWRPLAENEYFSGVRDALAVGRDMPTPQSGVPGPFGLADRDFTERVLREAGFAAIELTPCAAQYYVGPDVERAYAFARGSGFTRFATQDLDDAQRERAFAALRATIESHASGAGVMFDSACWLVSATRP